MEHEQSFTTRRTAATRRNTIVFLALQALIIPGFAFATFWTPRNAGHNQLPDLIDVPRRVRPQFDDRAVVTDAQLQAVLSKLRLPLPLGEPKINHVDHCLRMWGHEVAFPDTKYVAGSEMLAILTDDRVFQKYWGTTSRPFVVLTGDRLRLRTQEGSGSTSHVDHTLATLGEIGIPLTFEVRTRDGITSLGDIVRDAIGRFSLNQAEYEWTAMLLGMYVATSDPWYSREGQQITFDRIAERIMRQKLGQGVCYGGHRLFTLTLLRRIDREQTRLFSDSVRNGIDGHLREATRRLVSSQDVAGWWDNAWPGTPITESQEMWDRGRKLLATGHALEWWAISYADVLPPRETIVRAGQWLAREIESMDPAAVQKNLTFLTHAGRALALWRGASPSALFDDPRGANGNTHNDSL